MGAFLTNLKLVPSRAGSIAPSTFITIDGTQGDNMCRQATSATADMPVGIAQVGYDLAPGLSQLYPNATIQQVAANAGEPLQIFTDGDVAPLTVGAGGCTPGALLGVEAGTGNGVVVAKGSGKWYGAVAISSADQGEVVDAWVKLGVA